MDGLRDTNTNNNFLLLFCIFFCVDGLRGRGGFKQLKSLLGLAIYAPQANRQFAWRFPAPLRAAQSALSEMASACLQPSELPYLNSPVKLASPTYLKSLASLARPVPAVTSTPNSPMAPASCMLLKKQHHAGITLEINPFREYVSKSNP